MEPAYSNTEVKESQFLKERGKSHSPPWHKPRCFVYDCDNAKVEVRAKETVKGLLLPLISHVIANPLTFRRRKRFPKNTAKALAEACCTFCEAGCEN